MVYLKYPIKGLGGYNYLLNFKDHFSKYVWSFLLEDSMKSQIVKDFFKELLKTIPNMTIISIHTDNGS